MNQRIGKASRKSAETKVSVVVDLDGGDAKASTGIPFFDHMLSAFARHGRFGLEVAAIGDLEIDAHHTIEDVGIVLGRAFREALGDRAGIERTSAEYFPMDEALLRAAVDISGRGFLEWRVAIAGPYTAQIDLSVLEGFWRAFCHAAGVNLHVDALHGRDYHHVVEASFKAVGRALRAATRFDGTGKLASTKELLDG